MKKKYKKTKIIMFLLMSISLIIIGIFLFTNYQKKKLENEVYQYLINQKDYKDEEIYHMETFCTPGYRYSTLVTFKDEKNIYYEYIKVDNTILQVRWDDKPDPSKPTIPHILIKPRHAEVN